MIPKSCRLFGQDDAQNQRLLECDRVNLNRSHSSAQPPCPKLSCQVLTLQGTRYRTQNRSRRGTAEFQLGDQELICASARSGVTIAAARLSNDCSRQKRLEG